jgi:hypothetical protein
MVNLLWHGVDKALAFPIVIIFYFNQLLLTSDN